MFNRTLLGKWLWHYTHEREFVGELWWILNMAARGVSVLMRFLGRMGWGYRRISGGVGGF
jgi:hypothetical protein